MTLTAQHAVDVSNELFGKHPGYRALHATGILLKGTFTATPGAATLTRAAHMQGKPVPVTTRFSNGTGDPGHPDYASDVRGLAVKLYLPDGSRTDIVTNLPALKPPASYAAIRYYGVHAFRFLDADGGSHYVRYTFLPETEEALLSPGEARSRGRDYLQQEIRERVEREPVRFTLELQVAAPGDRTDDPSSEWPRERRRVRAGALELDGIETERQTGGDVLVFDPTRVTDGIELSDDPVLRFRHGAYSESIARRML